MTEVAQVYPLYTRQRHVIPGRDFVARVEMLCRSMIVREAADEWWMFGVEPGGLSEEGDTPNDARLRFNAAFETVLMDLAQEHANFEAFHAAVERFAHEVNEPAYADWMRSAIALGNGSFIPEHQFASLPRRPADTPCSVVVERIEHTALFERIDTTVEEPALAPAA